MLTGTLVDLGHNINTIKIWRNTVVQTFVPDKDQYVYWGILMTNFRKIPISNFIVYSVDEKLSHLMTFNM